jgi:hypothetical protein
MMNMKFKHISKVTAFTAVLFMLAMNIASTFVLVAGIDTVQYTSETPSGVRLNIRNNPSTNMIVTWSTTNGNTDSKVYFGASAGSLAQVASGGALVGVPGGYVHSVELAGLSPDTRYFYKCGGASGNSSTFNFTTAPALRSRGIHFAAYGDTRSNSLRRRIVADMILNNASLDFGTEAEMALHGGDIVSRGTEQGLFDEYNGDVQPLASHIPVMYTAGNHEISGSSSYYPEQYAEPENGNDGWYYSFNWGPVHIVCLDTETHGIPLLDAMDLNWIKEDLRRARMDNTVLWIVAWFHQPLYVSFSHESREDLRATWGTMFDQYGVDLVVASHCHAYQRNFPTSSDGAMVTAGTPHYVNPGKALHVVAGAGAVNSEGATNSTLRDDDFIATSPDPLFDAFGHRVFFPSNHFLNVNITIDESTNQTRLWVDVIGLTNYASNPGLNNYTTAKIDEFSITKSIPPSWYEPPNGVTYTGYSKTGSYLITVLVITCGCIAVVDVLIVVAWRRSRKAISKKN